MTFLFVYFLVKGWLSRETSRGYRVGQFWYLVSSDWYQNWLQYTQNPSTTPCTFCKSAATHNFHHHHHQRQISGGGGGGGARVMDPIVGTVDEAVVCDESFTSNSTESMGDLLAGNAADSSSLGKKKR